MKRVHLDEIESLPALDGELQWKPVRHTLGIDAFGINAYRAEQEGDLVVEEHQDPHQELYVVITGSARLTVLAVGAEAQRFDPSPWEYGFRAAGLIDLGRLDEARKALESSVLERARNDHLLGDLAAELR